MAKNSEETNQSNLILEYFKKNSGREIKHPEIVDWAVEEYRKRTGNVFRDPDRAIRKLAQQGQLIKISKGVYKYDPDFIKNRELEDFTPAQKKEIFERDNYRCVICGKGPKEGVEIHVDHIKPKELGGKATIENGQTLCAQHNFQKKYYKQTETGKRMFIRLCELAEKSKDPKLKKFCEDVLGVYEKHDINGHIVWEK
ncbi:MAG: HNH endonuclease [Nanoarchaeota archaeon]|nr:HNH endonuclease [Nanoarchaeota archaeon]